MGYSVFPAPSAGSKTRKITTLNSGTSYTVPAGVNYINVTTIGGGGAGAGGSSTDARSGYTFSNGHGGQIVMSTVNTTPGATINYTIGAGGNTTGSSGNGPSGGNAGGTTTFTGADSATGGQGVGANFANYTGKNSVNGWVSPNGGSSGNGSNSGGGAGGAGQIIIEYWE